MITPEPQSEAENHRQDEAGPEAQDSPPRHPAFWRNPNHWVAIATGVIAVANALYTFFALQQWNTMKGQLEQMRGGSSQTERLINETHALAQNAGTQAANARDLAGSSADQVKKLGVMAEAARKQAVALGDQLSVMRKQLEVTERPWVSVVHARAVGPLTFISDGWPSVPLQLVLRNHGHSPATSVQVNMAFLPAAPLDKLKENRDRLCTLFSQPDPHNWLGHVLFPGVDVPYRVELTGVGGWKGESRDGIVLVTCIVYSPAFNQDITYYSGTVYNTWRFPGNTKAGSSIPAEQLPLEPNQGAGAITR